MGRSAGVSIVTAGGKIEGNGEKAIQVARSHAAVVEKRFKGKIKREKLKLSLPRCILGSMSVCWSKRSNHSLRRTHTVYLMSSLS
jgi:hypothetical protein